MNELASRIKEFLIRESFHPGVTSLLTNPFHIARKGLHTDIKELAPRLRGRMLDVGCGTKPYRAFCDSSEYVGLEIERPGVPKMHGGAAADYYYDGKTFPFGDASFDSVITFEVLEHVFNVDGFLFEINRVLREGGLVLLAAPFVWDEHEQPFDSARYTSFGLRHLLEKHGFKIIEFRKSVADIRVLFQLINCYLHKQVSRWNVYFKLPAWVILTSPFNILGELLCHVLPANDDLYLNNVVLAIKIRTAGLAALDAGRASNEKN